MFFSLYLSLIKNLLILKRFLNISRFYYLIKFKLYSLFHSIKKYVKITGVVLF